MIENVSNEKGGAGEKGVNKRYNESYEVKQKAVRSKSTCARLPWIATLGQKETEMATAKSTKFRILPNFCFFSEVLQTIKLIYLIQGFSFQKFRPDSQL